MENSKRLIKEIKLLSINERKHIIAELENYYASDFLFDKILSLTVREFDSSPEIIRAKKRDEEFVLARHVVMYLAYHFGSFTYYKIGQQLGKRTHATVINGCKHIEELIKEDVGIAKIVKKIIEELTQL